MELQPTFQLPLTLGCTAEQMMADLHESEDIVDRGRCLEVEGYLDLEEFGLGDDYRKIITRVEDGRCVVITMAYMDLPVTDSFLGLDLNRGPTAERDFLHALHGLGINANLSQHRIILPDHFMTIELSECISWWDPSYWDKEELGTEDPTLDF